MAFASLLAASGAIVLVGQPITSVPGPDIRITELRQVAYDDLIEGRTQDAATELQGRLESDPDDPALLINLGAAYSRLGRRAEAAAAYDAAIASSTRYELELADGRWVDSRRAARLAQARLDGTTLLASR